MWQDPGRTEADWACEDLAVLVARRADLERDIDRLVVRARDEGAKWGRIGAVLGITVEGVRYRYKRMRGVVL